MQLELGQHRGWLADPLVNVKAEKHIDRRAISAVEEKLSAKDTITS
jgi:hypothetical protein